MADYYIKLEKQQQSESTDTEMIPVKSQAEPGYLKVRHDSSTS